MAEEGAGWKFCVPEVRPGMSPVGVASAKIQAGTVAARETEARERNGEDRRARETERGRVRERETRKRRKLMHSLCKIAEARR